MDLPASAARRTSNSAAPTAEMAGAEAMSSSAPRVMSTPCSASSTPPGSSPKTASRAAGSEGYDPVSRLLYTDLRGYFEGSILFNSTKIARGTGLDIRMPYCDLRMFDIACRMPSRFKATQDGNKLALRKAAERVLPMDAAYRKKMGFPVPISNWMKTPEMSSEIARAFESSSAEIFFDTDELGALLDSFLGKKPRVSHPIWFARHKALLWRHIWTIYVFIRWHEIFFGAAGK